MNSATSLPTGRRAPRLRASSVAAVVLGGVLAIIWLPLTLSLLIGGLGALPALGSGLLLLIPWILLMRLAVRLERWRAVAVHGMSVVVPAQRRSRRSGLAGWLHDLWLEISSLSFWRGVLHHHLALLVASVFCALSLTLLWVGWQSGMIGLQHGAVDIGALTLPRWASAVISGVLLVLSVLALLLGAIADRGLARGLISGSEEQLRGQVVELTHRRQGAVDAAAQERLRIERDLHDGVQPRLVALAMTLGMARGQIHSDPERAEQLVGQAHAEAKAVMTDLRQLARGIHPAVLTDRGLDAALSAVAARSPVPVDLEVQVTGPLEKEVEAVAYFVVSEALTNIARHSGADSATVQVLQTPESLRVHVEDDGRGGAQVRRDGQSTGLAGLTDRVRATGGRLEVASPAGGGTVLRAVIPTSGDPRSLDPRMMEPRESAAASASPRPARPAAAEPTTQEDPR